MEQLFKTKNKPFLKIGKRLIGENYQPVVIAEIGINHGGSLIEAKKIVDIAIKNGAEIIKHQTHVIDDEMTQDAKNVVPGNANKSIYEIMNECALNEDDEYELMKYIESKGAIFISTPFSRKAADRLEKFGVLAYKIGSGECNNYPLIHHICTFGKPIILSTGMNSIDSISKSVKIIREAGVKFALLHCTNVYPTPFNLIRLGGVVELANKFPDAVVGLSDHSITNHACLGAVALGASILERHFTDSMSRIGPDIICSMDGVALAELITGANIMAECRGGKKGPIKEEAPCINFAFATVVTIEDIKAGEVFTKENIWVKRPGTGQILAENFESILGKKASKNLGNGVHLSFSDITS